MKPPAKRKKPAQRRLVSKKTAFLRCISITASITESALACGMNRSMHYDWMRIDKKYPARFLAAKAEGADALEDEATRRARIGVFEPLVYQGEFQYERVETVNQKTGEITEARGEMLGVWKKSDYLLGLRLRAAKPEYRANAMELTGAGGGAVQSEHRIVFVTPGETK